MSTLAEYQKHMRNMLKGRSGPPAGDEHLALVARSPGLALLREISVWWRTLAVESYCPWTSRLLNKLGIFAGCVESFYCSQNVSPYVEKAGEQFLTTIGEHPQPLVAALARFELAILKVKRGDTREYCVEWDRNPDTVFASLLSGGDLPLAEADSYVTHISQAIPGLVSCDRLSTTNPSAG